MDKEWPPRKTVDTSFEEIENAPVVAGARSHESTGRPGRCGVVRRRVGEHVAIRQGQARHTEIVCAFAWFLCGIVASNSRDGHLRFRREWGLVASMDAPRGASMVAGRGWERVRVAKRPDSNGVEPIWHDSWHDSSSKGSSWALSEQWL
jgi:hypothetical protein